MLQRAFAMFAVVVALAAGGAGAQAQQWLLNSDASHFYMQTAKANASLEIHRFTGLDGTITPAGEATFKIDLISVSSGIDVRDVRMRFLLFETYKFPYAEVKAKVDLSKLGGLSAATRVPYDLRFALSLHGFTKELEAPVVVTRLSDRTVSVASAKPIVITAESFGLLDGIAKLSEAVNGTPIVTAASFTFDLVFETGDRVPALEAARLEASNRRTAAETSSIGEEACGTRFSVISAARAIHFKSGSAELDKASEPILESITDIARRCAAVRVEVSGHTDSVGSKDNNQ